MPWRLLPLLRFRIDMLLRPLMSRLPVGFGISPRAYRSIVGKNRGFRRDGLYKERIPAEKRYRVFFDRFIKCRVRVDITDWAGQARCREDRDYDDA